MKENNVWKKNEKYKYFIAYTGCFLAIAIIVYSCYFLNGKTLVWKDDGIPQHFNALLYYRDWIREIFHVLFTEHRLEIPLWDLNIGYGSDVINTFHYYVLGDPLTVFCTIVPKVEWLDEFYSALVVLRIYLAGLGFSWFCAYHKNGKFPTLLGALLYSFSYWGVLAAVRHPYFMNPLIYFPVILIGVDRFFAKKKPGLFIGALAVSILSNFYFGYMICVMVLIYCIFRYIMIFGRIRIKEVLQWIGRFAGCAFLACGLAGVLLMPSVLCVLSAGRSQVERMIPLFYPKSFYHYFISAFLADGAGYWNNMGYTAFGVIGIFLLFLQDRKFRIYKIGFLVLTGLMLIPYAGHVFNGFSYETNRFCWGMTMLASYILVKVWPDMTKLSMRKKKLLTVMTLVYAGICVLDEWCRTELLAASLVLMGLLLLWLVLFVKDWMTKGRKHLVQITAAGGLCVCLAVQGVYKYSPAEGNYVADFADNNEAMLSLTSHAASSAVAEVKDDTVWRYDTAQISEVYNTPVQLGVNGVSYYWSLADRNIFQFQKEMYANIEKDFRYQNLDGRSFLDALAAVKYFEIPAGAESYLPYGYTMLVNSRWTGKDDAEAQRREAAEKSVEGLEASKVSVYTTENWLPLGYAYDTWISRDEYESMNVVQKQQALLQGVVLENSTLPYGKPEFTDKTQMCSAVVGEEIEAENNGILVKKPGATVTLNFEGCMESETYFIVEGLDFEGVSPKEQYTAEEMEKLSEYEKEKVIREDKMWTKPDMTTITVSDGVVTKNLNYLNQVGGTYADIHDFMINLGYGTEKKSSITLTFQKAGHYTWDNYSVVCQPIERLGSYVEQRKQETLQNISVTANRISGSIQTSGRRVLLLAIPYSRGWKAFVDGKPAELKPANTMYMGLELESGTHEIELCYTTPGLTTGMLMTLTCGCGCVAWWEATRILSGKRRRKKESSKNMMRKPGGQ